jgi:hypothetical protein
MEHHIIFCGKRQDVCPEPVFYAATGGNAAARSKLPQFAHHGLAELRAHRNHSRGKAMFGFPSPTNQKQGDA